MSTVLTLTEIEPVVLHLGPALKRMTDHEFYEFCRLNDELKIELTSDGDLIIMPPTGGKTGERNFTITSVLGAWVEVGGAGVGFDSSTIFSLPNGAKRSPDLAWVRRSRWEALSDEEQEEFPPICPDFVVELRSAEGNFIPGALPLTPSRLFRGFPCPSLRCKTGASAPPYGR